MVCHSSKLKITESGSPQLTQNYEEITKGEAKMKHRKSQNKIMYAGSQSTKKAMLASSCAIHGRLQHSERGTPLDSI